jgi:hypothetical protein
MEQVATRLASLAPADADVSAVADAVPPRTGAAAA